MLYIIIVCAAKLKSVEINKLLMHVRVDLGYLIWFFNYSCMSRFQPTQKAYLSFSKALLFDSAFWPQFLWRSKSSFSKEQKLNYNFSLNIGMDSMICSNSGIEFVMIWINEHAIKKLVWWWLLQNVYFFAFMKCPV